MSYNIAFIHPDLGIGGAERLIIDMALSLMENHSVTIYTAHHDPLHSFSDIKKSSLKVIVYGDWIPRHIFNRFYAFFAYIRMIYCTLRLIINGYIYNMNNKRGFLYDVIIADQIPIPIPLILLFTPSLTCFYCHYPDLLLAPHSSFFTSLYRLPIDLVEEFSIYFSDIIFANSQFTKAKTISTFTSLQGRDIHILYPSIDTDITRSSEDIQNLFIRNLAFVSINRFERKKRIDFAIKAFNITKQVISIIDLYLPSHLHLSNLLQLLLCGGYDFRVQENVQHYDELLLLAKKLSLSVLEYSTVHSGNLGGEVHSGDVVFWKNFSDSHRRAIFNSVISTIYTPPNEHFGIVPIESMLYRDPVIACNSGGPMETVGDSITPPSGGILCDENEVSFSNAMLRLIFDIELRNNLRESGYKKVLENYSISKFAETLQNKISNKASQMVNKKIFMLTILKYFILLLIGISIFCYLFNNQINFIS